MTRFNLQKARKTYGVQSKYQGFPSDTQEQIKLLGEYGYNNLKIGKGISLKNAKASQVYAFAKRVFNDSHNYWQDLNPEQKKQVPEYCFDQYLKLKYHLSKVEQRLKSPENLSLVFRLHSNFLDEPTTFEVQKQLVEQYAHRQGSLNISNLDQKEIQLYSKHIYKTIKDIIQTLNPANKEIIHLSDQISKELIDISKIPSKEGRSLKIRDLEQRLNLSKIEERISIQYEHNEIKDIPYPIKTLHTLLNLRHQIEQGQISNPEISGNIRTQSIPENQSFVDRILRKKPIVKHQLVHIAPTEYLNVQEELFQEKIEEVPF